MDNDFAWLVIGLFAIGLGILDSRCKGPFRIVFLTAVFSITTFLVIQTAIMSAGDRFLLLIDGLALMLIARQV